MKHDVPRALAHLPSALADLESMGLLRRRPLPVHEPAATFCSNDYLGLGAKHGGSGASRLIVGERPEHVALETAFAEWLGTDGALMFSSGYAANVGVVSSLAAEGDLIVSDALNHASIIDGARLSRARCVVVPHLDHRAVGAALAEPRTGRAWVVTESYFSMDADTPDFPALREMCDQAGAALVVDEAHALGVLGPDGRGLCAESGVRPDVLIGTFGKAFGSSGAFVAGCDPLLQWLWNRARSFVFSTGASGLAANAALRAFDESRRQPELRGTTVRRAKQLRDGLGALGLAPLGHGPIVPLVVGSAEKALRVAAVLRDHGIHVPAIRPPTVPEGTARLRFATTARHSAADIERLLAAMEKALPWLR